MGNSKSKSTKRNAGPAKKVLASPVLKLHPPTPTRKSSSSSSSSSSSGKSTESVRKKSSNEGPQLVQQSSATRKALAAFPAGKFGVKPFKKPNISGSKWKAASSRMNQRDSVSSTGATATSSILSADEEVPDIFNWSAGDGTSHTTGSGVFQNSTLSSPLSSKFSQPDPSSKRSSFGSFDSDTIVNTAHTSKSSKPPNSKPSTPNQEPNMKSNKCLTIARTGGCGSFCGPRPAAPPVCISSYGGGGGGCGGGGGGWNGNRGGPNPLDRLRNVDVIESLCYYPPKEDSESFDGDEEPMDMYELCEDCGSMEYIGEKAPEKKENLPGSRKPVTYTRKQRFNFTTQDDLSRIPCFPEDDGPPFVWPSVANPRHPPHRACSYDEIPVGKNPKYKKDNKTDLNLNLKEDSNPNLKKDLNPNLKKDLNPNLKKALNPNLKKAPKGQYVYDAEKSLLKPKEAGYDTIPVSSESTRGTSDTSTSEHSVKVFYGKSGEYMFDARDGTLRHATDVEPLDIVYDDEDLGLGCCDDGDYEYCGQDVRVPLCGPQSQLQRQPCQILVEDQMAAPIQQACQPTNVSARDGPLIMMGPSPTTQRPMPCPPPGMMAYDEPDPRMYDIMSQLMSSWNGPPNDENNNNSNGGSGSGGYGGSRGYGSYGGSSGSGCGGGGNWNMNQACNPGNPFFNMLNQMHGYGTGFGHDMSGMSQGQPGPTTTMPIIMMPDALNFGKVKKKKRRSHVVEKEKVEEVKVEEAQQEEVKKAKPNVPKRKEQATVDQPASNAIDGAAKGNVAIGT